MRRDARWVPLLAAAMLTGSIAAREPMPDREAGLALPSATTPARRIFLSGHSLTDRPFPDHLAAIGSEAGHEIDWNMQYRAGSSLRERMADDPATTARDGLPIDLPHALAEGYDTLILTEQHTLLGSLIGGDTIGHAAALHQRFVAANPGGRSFLFASWLDLSSKDDPARWIAYEAAAAPVWGCVVDRINRRGTSPPMTLIPAAAALAALVQRATGPGGLPGVSAATVRGTMARLFVDDVHLTPTATYYTALVAHATIAGSLPAAAWAPTGMNPATAKALQRFAASFVAAHRRSLAWSPQRCRMHVVGTYAPLYLAYQRDTRWREDGLLRAHLRWARHRVSWHRLLRSDRPENPFGPRDG